ncbi:MAG: hydroxyethylthiazole kinase [Eggerthellaceae bacterium]|nr:hydroxyethylthiazole kinase [Eggerthellaceae bacterium]
MRPFALRSAIQNVRDSEPLIHCITNYVTVNDCANALLACGASPIMTDEPKDVEDIASICSGLVINIGTLNERSIEAMRLAGARFAQLGRPIVLDPVGAGASRLRTETACTLLDTLPVSVIRGNMSEIKALVGASAATRGVDVNPDDVTTEENLAQNAEFARSLAAKTGAVVVITGAIDIVADSATAYAVRNGSPLMGKMTGAGCVLTCLVAAFVAANPDAPLEAALAAVVCEGLAGQIAANRMSDSDGNASFRTYLIDAIFRLDGDALEAGALVSRVD